MRTEAWVAALRKALADMGASVSEEWLACRRAAYIEEQKRLDARKQARKAKPSKKDRQQQLQVGRAVARAIGAFHFEFSLPRDADDFLNTVDGQDRERIFRGAYEGLYAELMDALGPKKHTVFCEARDRIFTGRGNTWEERFTAAWKATVDRRGDLEVWLYGRGWWHLALNTAPVLAEYISAGKYPPIQTHRNKRGPGLIGKVAETYLELHPKGDAKGMKEWLLTDSKAQKDLQERYGIVSCSNSESGAGVTIRCPGLSPRRCVLTWKPQNIQAALRGASTRASKRAKKRPLNLWWRPSR